ncbi:MAG: DUF1080 domain-containing protein, partial [Verrucomicrobiota bacterium]
MNASTRLFSAAARARDGWPLLMACALAAGCASGPSAHPPNTLSQAEARKGWTLLFDGRSTDAWRGFGKDAFPTQGWEVADGWLHHRPKAGGGDLVTRAQFDAFELEFEWRIAPGGNSGVKYFIDEKRGAPIGHEYQVIDDAAHPDASHGPKRQTAALYDALPPVNPTVTVASPSSAVPASTVGMRPMRSSAKPTKGRHNSPP